MKEHPRLLPARLCLALLGPDRLRTGIRPLLFRTGSGTGL